MWSKKLLSVLYHGLFKIYLKKSSTKCDEEPLLISGYSNKSFRFPAAVPAAKNLRQLPQV
jgi:hypothetical protein